MSSDAIVSSSPLVIDYEEDVAPYRFQETGRVAYLLLWAYVWGDRVLINYIEGELEGAGSLKMVLYMNFLYQDCLSMKVSFI